MLPEALLDSLVEPVLVLDAGGVRFANRAALRHLPVEVGLSIAELRHVFDDATWQWLSRAIGGAPRGTAPGAVPGPVPGEVPVPPRPGDGRAAPVLERLDERRWALCLPPDALRLREPVPVLQIADGPLRHVHAMLWGSPFPALLQDESFRILDVNPAYLGLTGLERDRLLGRDPIDWQPHADRAETLADRERLMRDPSHPEVPALVEQRVVDHQGQLRWLRAARYVTLTQDGRRLLLTLMQETTAEHAARDQAERYSRELDQWFDRAPLGMALLDPAGLVLRANGVFTQLVGGSWVDLHEAPAPVQALLRWQAGRWTVPGLADGAEAAVGEPVADGAAAGAWSSQEGRLTQADGHARWVRALLRSYEAPGGPRRIMCMLEDRTAEEERDQAQLQIGALVDTAGVGVTTVHGPLLGARAAVAGGGPAPSFGLTGLTGLAGESGFGSAVGAAAGSGSGAISGAVAGAAAGASAGAVGQAAPGGSALTTAAVGEPGGRGPLLQGVRREWVLPASLPEFERLQRALRQAERCEVRYAIEHPELGLRWLVTRVEPGHTASGQSSTSLVTLDVTEQQRAQERAEQLLAELSTILESSPAGIASMRGYTLMHCNRRFERMLGLKAGAGVGSDIRALLASRITGTGSSGAAGGPGALGDTLDQGVLYEAELEVPGEDGSTHWYALSIYRTGPLAQDDQQAIAVVSEITRLKAQQAQLESLAHERERMALVLGQQADRTRAVLDSVLVGIVTVNDAGLISWLNRSARRMFGGDLGDFMGQRIDAVATADELHPFRRTLDLFGELRDGEALMFECRVQGRDGRTFWVVGNAVNTVSVQGQRELTFALMDIEQRRQAEARIAEARASLQRIIEAAPMAIALCDAASLAVLQLNRVAAGLCGLSAEAAVGQRPEQIFPPSLALRVQADLQAALASPAQVTQREYRWEQGGAWQVWDARYLSLARPDSGVVDQILLVATDVSTQRAAQQAELEAAIAQREMLVQEVHHRIKNNLQGVAGLMQQIAQRRPEVQPVIAEVVGQVQAIAQVYGLQVGGIGPLRLRSVMAAIAQSVQRTFGREIALVVECETGTDTETEWALPEAESIPIALTLNELLTNAIKHSPADSAVGLRLVCERAGVRVEIASVGRLPPGFRIEHRPSTVSGLGLVRALLPRRNASLGIEQRGERVVAVVSLAVPVVTALAAAPAATPRTSPPSAPAPIPAVPSASSSVSSSVLPAPAPPGA